MTHHGTTLRLRVLGIALFTLAAAAVFVYFEALAGVDLLPRATYTLHATAPDAVALSDHADVLEAGVKVGTVDGIDRAGARTALTLTLEERYSPVYRDGQIQIRAKTLAGENYVALDPGTPATGALPSGGTLPSVAPEATQLDQILSTFDAPHRRDLQRLLDVLGTGLGGHGQALNRLLGGSADLVDKATPVFTVLGADRAQVAALIDDFGTVTASLGQRSADIQRLVRSARTASIAVAARDADVRALFRVLPGFLAQARTTVAHLGAFSLSATPVLHNLRLATADLVPAIHALGPASREGSAILSELGPFADNAIRAASSLKRFSPVATALMSPLQAVLRQANPLLAYLAPYALDFGTLFSSMDGPNHYRDGSAGYARVAAILSNNLISGVSPQEDQLMLALQKAGILPFLAIKQYNPYPRPGTATHPVPYSGTYPQIQADPPYKPPRTG
jgi:phospholipid/cholesterol/gamma-HCH transport system substrate-binding protein